MKRLATIAKRRGGELVLVEGASHTKVRIGQTITMVLRHGEISEGTARGIIKKMEEE